MNKIIGSEVTTIKGKGIVEDIYITELNLLMVRVRFGKVWTNYRLSELKDIQRIIFETNE